MGTNRCRCLWYTEWLCEDCRPEECANYEPEGVKVEVEVTDGKQLKLFDI